jgi:hypothetical protein
MRKGHLARALFQDLQYSPVLYFRIYCFNKTPSIVTFFPAFFQKKKPTFFHIFFWENVKSCKKNFFPIIGQTLKIKSDSSHPN